MEREHSLMSQQKGQFTESFRVYLDDSQSFATPHQHGKQISTVDATRNLESAESGSDHMTDPPMTHTSNSPEDEVFSGSSVDLTGIRAEMPSLKQRRMPHHKPLAVRIPDNNTLLRRRPVASTDKKSVSQNELHSATVHTIPTESQAHSAGNEQECDSEGSIDISGLRFEEKHRLTSSQQRIFDEAATEYKRLPLYIPRRSQRERQENAGSLEMPRNRPVGTIDHAEQASDHKSEQQEDADAFFCCRRSKKAVQSDQLDASYCPKCEMIYCEKCWANVLVHRKERAGHQRVDPNVAKWVKDTLEADMEDDEQAQRHLFDDSAFWFGAGLNERGEPVFRECGRYASLISEMVGTQKIRRFASIVSFVGDTGAGKSSLIKLLISLNAGRHTYEAPIVGSPENGNRPTSGDVHLYQDPSTFHSSDPIFYADCEGLNGGTRDPIGAKYKKRPSCDLGVRQGQASRTPSHVKKTHNTSEREIVWANTPEKLSRDYFVRNLYPRLLYTFSDVVVFVVRNHQTIEPVVEQLITWANAVIEASSNQPVLPHAIIVLNASAEHKSEVWEVNDTTEDIMEDLREIMITNKRLQKLAKVWNEKGTPIRSIRSLLRCYYRSVRAVRIPEGSRPQIIHDQVKVLYQEIANATKASQGFKSSLRMKISCEELQPYLHSAFDHVCKTLKKPFDWVKASNAHCTIPPDFGGNILKLVLIMMEHFKNRLDGPHLFKEVSFPIASCIMLDAVRRRILGPADTVFFRYIPHLDEVLEDFCSRYWPCEYVSLGGRCVNVKAGHIKGHQLENAKVVESGAEYYSTFDPTGYREQFLNDVFSSLQDLLDQLPTLQNDSDIDEREAAFKLHRNSVLRHFYRHLEGADNFNSHSICLACLVYAPQHYLPCGHIICTSCVEAFGHRRGPAAVALLSCPLHDDRTFLSRWTITLQPQTAGVRILTLDGGGVRGIVELASLAAIEQELGGSLRIRSFFDLIVGTGTGGIIALGLAEKGLSVKECTRQFITLSDTAFARNTRLRPSIFEKLLMMWKIGKYDSGPLEYALREQFGEDRLFGGAKGKGKGIHGNISRPKVAVTATSVDGNAYLLANYNRAGPGESPGYKFLRAERPEDEIKTWEAARATCAAPKIFRPFDHTASGHTFLDGGIYYNNPVEVAMREARFAYPEIGDRPPDIFLSLGTTLSIQRASEAHPLAPSSPLGCFKDQKKIAEDHIRHAMISQHTWGKFKDSQRNEYKHRFFRLNYEIKDKLLKVDDVSKMPSLQKIIEADLQTDGHRSRIKKIARKLLATAFYFRPTKAPEVNSDKTMTIFGQIECRFPQDSPEITGIGKLLLRRQTRLYNSQRPTEDPSFIFQQRQRGEPVQKILVTREIIDAMRTEGKFEMKPVTFEVTSYLAETDIYFRFGDESSTSEHNSISGFPRCWDNDPRPSLRPSLSLSRKRESQSTRARPVWSKPREKLTSSLEKYAENDLPGMATKLELLQVEEKLTQPDLLRVSARRTYIHDDLEVLPFGVSPASASTPGSHFTPDPPRTPFPISQTYFGSSPRGASAPEDRPIELGSRVRDQQTQNGSSGKHLESAVNNTEATAGSHDGDNKPNESPWANSYPHPHLVSDFVWEPYGKEPFEVPNTAVEYKDHPLFPHAMSRYDQ